MKNITVTVDEQTYRRARIRAAELDTSVSALVRDYLEQLGAEESADERFERLKRLEEGVRTRIKGFSASDRLSRDELYDRRR
jgi:plasmid stability protein